MTTKLINITADNVYREDEAAKAQHGLYVLFFQNKRNEDIYDNNKNREKIIVHRNSISIKPGKFENGFSNRLTGYKKHLHIRKANKEKEYVFNESFIGAIVLSLDNIEIGFEKRYSPRIFENYWILHINKALEDKRLIHSKRIKQNPRTEWIYAEPEFTETIMQECTFLANKLSQKINSF